MASYTIAPTLTRISLNSALSAQFSDLDKRLAWKPLTTSLDSCEHNGFLYFRVLLKSCVGSDTYAGFPAGVPFILTRDAEVKNRKFFLRHWIRKPSAESKLSFAAAPPPLTEPDHMIVGGDGSAGNGTGTGGDAGAADDKSTTTNQRLLVRVNIDRPLVARDTFNSHTFATMMFQVVQVDAIIEEIPEVRFAFAIERTVTQDERDVLAKVHPNLARTITSKGLLGGTMQHLSNSSINKNTTTAAAARASSKRAVTTRLNKPQTGSISGSGSTASATTASPMNRAGTKQKQLSNSQQQTQLQQQQAQLQQHLQLRQQQLQQSHAQAGGTPMTAPRFTPPAAQLITPLAPMQRMIHPTPMQAPAMQQALMYQRGISPFGVGVSGTGAISAGATQPNRAAMLANRPSTAAIYAHNPYHFVPHQRHVPMQMRQAVGGVGGRPTILTPQQQQQLATQSIRTPSTAAAAAAAAAAATAVATARGMNRPTTTTINIAGTPPTLTTLAPTPPALPVPLPIPNTAANNAASVNTNATNHKQASGTATGRHHHQQQHMINSSKHYSGIVENTKSSTHPDVRLWEDHDANDPYEPFFITEDAKFDEQSKKKVILDHATEVRDRFDHNELFGLCSSDFPAFYATGPDVHADGDQADVELVVEKIAKDELDFGRSSSRSHFAGGAGGKTKTGATYDRSVNDYMAAVVSACAYNSTLGEERKGLRQWLVEDAERQEARSEEEEEDDDGDSMSE